MTGPLHNLRIQIQIQREMIHVERFGMIVLEAEYSDVEVQLPRLSMLSVSQSTSNYQPPYQFLQFI